MTQEYEANSEIQVTAFTLGRLFESLDKIENIRSGRNRSTLWQVYKK